MALRLLTVLCLTAMFTGCSPRRAPDVAPEDTETRLAATTDLDVKGWLEKPRAELAKLAEEYEATVANHLDRLRKDPKSAEFLPALRVPTQGAVFHKAAFRPERGFSVPDYVTAAADPAVAAHLAWHGDQEAAQKLGGKATSDKSYPVEWTRAVAFALIDAQFKLASGERQAAADLVLAHKQIQDVLDDTAEVSGIGAVLLPAGKRALFLAAKAWRDPKVNLTRVASDVDEALAAWGDAAAPVFPPLTRDDVAAVWGSDVKGNVAVAAGGSTRARVLDLLGGGVPADGVSAVGAFLDATGKLAEVQFAYRSGLDTLYPEPADLAFLLEQRGLEAGKEEKTAGLHRQPFTGPGLSADVIRTNRTPALGALVRLTPPKPESPAAGPADRRAFGPVHLDRPFESARLRLDPKLTGNPLAVNDKPALEKLVTDLRSPVPTAATIDRDGELVGGVHLVWPPEMADEDSAGLIAALWSAFGGPAVSESAEPAALVFAWKDAATALEFRLPLDGKPKTLVATDAQPAAKQLDRLKAAQAFDAKERAERVAGGKADERLATGPGAVNGVSVVGLKIGATKEQAEAALPTGKGYRRKALPDGVVVLIDTQPDKVPFWAKQLLVRYAAGKVAEVRVRYLESDPKAHLAKLSADPVVGPGEEVPADWQALWADVPGGKAATVRWRDDRTERTYQREGGNGEVIWRDRSAELVPWRFVTAGPGKVGIGSTREQFIAAYGPPPTTSGAAQVFRQTEASPYGMLLVWFEGEKATRIVGVHKAKPTNESVEAVNLALGAWWGRDVSGLGFPTRQTPRRGEVLGGMAWHDDAVRVHTYAQDAEDGLRMLTEWRAWPFAVHTPVAGR